MAKAKQTQSRFRIYVVLMGGIALILLTLLLKGSLKGTEPVAPINQTRKLKAEQALPFIWTRTIKAGEKISDDMFMLQRTNAEAEALNEADLNQQLLLLRGRYLLENQFGGIQLNQNVISDELPRAAKKGSQAIWIALSEKQRNGFSNFSLDETVAACANPFSELVDGLGQLRILAMDREANALCLELTAGQHIQILTKQGEGELFLIPVTGAMLVPTSTVAQTEAVITTETTTVSTTETTTVATTVATESTVSETGGTAVTQTETLASESSTVVSSASTAELTETDASALIN